MARTLARRAALATAAGLAGVGNVALAAEAPAADAVVLAPVTVPGAARRGATELPPELELASEDIELYGALTIGELLGDLGSLVDPSGQQPEVMVNGRRIGGAREIAGFPPDALERVEVLPREASQRYGYSSDRRVVNLVLRPHFASLQGTGEAGWATAGGRANQQLSAERARIDEDVRSLATGRGSRQTALTAGERPMPTQQPERTLSPAQRSASLDATFTRPVGELSGTLSLNADVSARRQTSLFGVRSEQQSGNFGLSGGLTGRFAGWDGRLGLDTQASVSDRLGAGRGFGGDPAANPSPGQAQIRSVAAQANLNRAVFTLPAGKVRATTSLSLNHTRSKLGFGGEGERWRVRDFAQARGGLFLPIVPSTRPETGPPWGGVTLNLGGGVSAATAQALRSGGDLGLSWAPRPSLQLRAAYSVDQAAPTTEELAGAQVENANVRIFDVRRGEMAEIVRVTGGNPALEPGLRRSLSFGVTLGPTPIGMLRTEWRRSVAENAVGQLPALTPEVEAAFPDRVVRDGTGKLVRLDARPINLARDRRDSLTTSLTLGLPMGGSSAAPGMGRGARGFGRRMPSGPGVMINLSHTWRWSDELLIRPGLPVIDRLAAGGAARHELQLQANGRAWRATFGITGRWRSPSRIRRVSGVDGPDDLKLSAFGTVDLQLSLPIGPLKTAAGAQGAPAGPPMFDMAKGVRLSFEVQNLFNGYAGARLGDGRPAAGYGRYEQDVVGRVVRVRLSRRF